MNIILPANQPAPSLPQRVRTFLLWAGAMLSALFLSAFMVMPAEASQAYGSINNFDTVNDTGHVCHGFEIEIEDCRSTDITYTYNYNHYGVPRFEQDDTDPAHPKCRIRWESKKNADGSWAAHTSIPAGPINPTDGHQFTNPNVNFGGEHFGVGFRLAVGTIRYNWLIDNGSGTLVHGGAVQVATPVFTYYPRVAAAPAQVQAVIAPPVPPVPPVKEFGKAVWVKEIKTTTHNNNKIKLRELVSDDPDDANDKNWANGEPDEIEVEWRILQKKTSAADGGPNGELAAAPEELPNGDEVVTRRYEFYKYTGPLDAESGEAMADEVDADGLHGTGMRTYNHHMVGGEWVEVTEDMTDFEVVGDFTGSQMAAVDVEAAVGLIEHVSEGKVNAPYAARTLVVEGALPFACVREGALPAGMDFDEVTGLLSGTPTASGTFQFRVIASDFVNPDVEKSYTLRIAAAGAALPPASLVDTAAVPVVGGTTAGDGSYAPGSNVTVIATAEPGYHFVNWTEAGQVVSNTASHTFAIDVNHSLVANFAPDTVQRTIATSAAPVAGGTTSGGGVVDDGSSVTVVATPNAGYTFTNWTEGGVPVSAAASYTFNATADRVLVADFALAPNYTISTSATPSAGGSTSGSGSFPGGGNRTVVSTPNAGYEFVNWTESGTHVSALASYTFTLTGNRTLVAHFQVAAGGGGSTPVAIASEYTVTDITDWTPAQKAALPYFDRYVPVAPAGASADFVATAQNGFGVVAGNRNFANTWVQGSGALVSSGATTSVSAWGQYSWSYTYSDGTDNHFSNGFVQHSSVADVNLSGLVVGYANITGAQSGAAASTAYLDHGFIYDPASGLKIDITPDATRATPRSINDHGFVVGSWSNGAVFHGFLRAPDGTMQDFSGLGSTNITPSVITNRGLVAGSYRTAANFTRPFVSTAGLNIVDLGLPSQGGVDTGYVADANDHGMIVGSASKAASPGEPNGVRWYREGGVWIAEDLNEVNATGGFVIDGCIAVNDAGYIIATGHLDGAGVINNRTFLLTPDKWPAPTVVTLAAEDLTPTGATLVAKINACTKSTTVAFHSGPTTTYGQSSAATSGTVTGTAPALSTVALTNLAPGTTYHFRASAVNSKGTTHGDDFTFTTPHTLASWTTLKFGAQAGDAAVAGPDVDFDHDGETNFAEYAFGHDPTRHDSAQPPASIEAGGLCLSYTRPTDHAGLVYVVEVATNLAGPWNSGPGFTEDVSVAVNGTLETVQTRSVLSAVTYPQQFLRIRATQLP